MNNPKAIRFASIAVLMTLTWILTIGIAAGAVNAQTPPWEQAVTGLTAAPGDSAESLAIS